MTAAIPAARQIQIKMGPQWGNPQVASLPKTLPFGQPLMPLQVVNVPKPATGTTLSREQLDRICTEIQKTTRSFGISNPKLFALNNCPLVQMYYKQVSRFQS
ncbi:hypothetical protein COOONC_18554 [Cooperia oncophora]